MPTQKSISYFTNIRKLVTGARYSKMPLLLGEKRFACNTNIFLLSYKRNLYTHPFRTRPPWSPLHKRTESRWWDRRRWRHVYTFPVHSRRCLKQNTVSSVVIYLTVALWQIICIALSERCPRTCLTVVSSEAGRALTLNVIYQIYTSRSILTRSRTVINVWNTYDLIHAKSTC